MPNHVGVATPPENPWWWDLLKHGRDSERAVAFDVDWAAGGGRIRIPVVADADQAREGGPIAHLEIVDGELRYYDNRFPIAPGSAKTGPTTGQTRTPSMVASTTSWSTGMLPTTASTTGGSSRSTPWPRVRVENPDVFADSHVEIKRWFDEGLVDGLRVDHPDGLHDPQGYLDDLAELTGGAYVLVEKILETGEHLPASWSTEGTTGYDALAHIDRVLTDPAGQRPLDALETRLRGRPVDWLEMIHDTKRAVVDGMLRSEVLPDHPRAGCPPAG